MRKLITASAVAALAVGLTAAPGVFAKKSVKQVATTVTVSATPTADTTTTATTGVSVSGNVKANSSCRKNRTVHFHYVVGGAQGAEVGTPATTGPNGDFAASLPSPSPLADGTAQVRAVVDETLRAKTIRGKNKGASKGKKKGATQKRKFNCLEGSADSNAFVTSDGVI
jgi:hypothetical protein